MDDLVHRPVTVPPLERRRAQGRCRASRAAGTVTRRTGGFECPKALGDVFRAVIGIMDTGESTPADRDVLDVVRTGWVEHPGYFAPAQLWDLTFELEQDHATSPADAMSTYLLDTEVYSNTGGQCSKSTPRAAVAKFASAGKRAGKKDLGMMAMTYGNIYVASVAMGAKDEHTLKAFIEAEAYDGPALIIAYSHCIAHGINMTTALQNQKAAVNCVQWLLYRYDPQRAAIGENPLQLDSPAPRIKVADYFKLENRFKMLGQSDPPAARAMLAQAQEDAHHRRTFYELLATRKSEPISVP